MASAWMYGYPFVCLSALAVSQHISETHRVFLSYCTHTHHLGGVDKPLEVMSFDHRFDLHL